MDDDTTPPIDPFETLRTEASRVIEYQHARGALLPAMEAAAKAEQGGALTAIRRALNALDPRPPEPSKTITPALLRAAKFTQTVDAEDDGERRKAVRLWREALDAPDPDRREAVALSAIAGDLPQPLVSVADQDGHRDGALLSAGTVAVLAGAGGSAKTALALHLAIEAGATPDRAHRPACGGALVVAGGPALYVAYEDAPPVLRDRAARLVENLGDDFRDAMRSVYLLPMAGRPLFGPAGGVGLYNARPGPLEGWCDLWAAVDATRARLVIVDPVLCAYVGESNAAAPVREFLGALAAEAGKRCAGVLLVCHSTKAARSGGEPNLYEPGHVGGSTHWVDGVRGVLHLVRDRAEFTLAVAKANYGPAFQHVRMTPKIPVGGDRVVIGMAATGGWTPDEPAGRNGDANHTTDTARKNKVGSEVDTSEV